MRPLTHPLPGRWRTIATVLACVLLASAAALVAHRSVKPVATAATHVFVDTASPSILHRAGYPVAGLTQRGELLGRVLASPPMVQRIAALVGVPADQVGADARTTARVPAAFTEPGSEERAQDIVQTRRPYRIEIEARQSGPVVDIYAEAPSTASAARLADAVVRVGIQHLQELGDQQGLAASDRIVLRQLEPARGGVVNGGLAAGVGAVTFALVLTLALIAARWARRRERRLAVAAPDDGADLWPHTARPVPWAFAVFLAVVWLVPFNDILLKIPTPIDLTFDRLVLPVVVAVWLFALLAGGPRAPRLRVTRIHLAVGAFVVLAFLSVIFNASALNGSLELQGALKQLPLLLSYVSLFAIASTAVRSREIRAFMSYILGLAVVCALGVVWEYRFKQNLFYIWSDKLLPGPFSVGLVDSAAVDDIGRRVVRGPAAVPLETVAMLAMALPIPLVRLTQSPSWRERIVYGLAACLLFAAALATFRKSALLAPISVVGTLAYFRRSELLKLAPLALVLLTMIPVLAPGAIGMTTTQFEPSRLGVATVSDRSSDYDAVRPDVWTHLLFGRGWGSYDHATYRVLDSEILHRVIEMGVLGLLAYVVMIVSVVAAARRTIMDRDRTWAPPALMGAAAAVSFAVVSTLFDVMAFPHAVYIFLCMAGLTAVTIAHDADDRAERARRREARQAAPTEEAELVVLVGPVAQEARRAGVLAAAPRRPSTSS